MHVNEPNHRAIIATSWGGMLALLLAMLMLSPLQYAMNGQYEALTKVLREDPSPLGLQVLIVMLCLNALVQVTVHARSCRTAKVSVFILSVLYGLFFLAHNIVHMIGGEPLGLQSVLDFQLSIQMLDRMKHTPRETEVPLNSRAAELLEGASFYDAWRINSARVDRSALEHFLAAAATTPRWVNTAMSARNRVVQLFGLKNLGTLDNLERTREPKTYKPGDRIGIFTLFENSFDEVLLGDRDKHLNVVLSVHRRLLPGCKTVEVTLTTVVHVKNLLGRLYMLPVTPAHRIIAPAMLAGIAEHPDAA